MFFCDLFCSAGCRTICVLFGGWKYDSFLQICSSLCFFGFMPCSIPFLKHLQVFHSWMISLLDFLLHCCSGFVLVTEGFSVRNDMLYVCRIPGIGPTRMVTLSESAAIFTFPPYNVNAPSHMLKRVVVSQVEICWTVSQLEIIFRVAWFSWAGILCSICHDVRVWQSILRVFSRVLDLVPQLSRFTTSIGTVGIELGVRVAKWHPKHYRFSGEKTMSLLLGSGKVAL